MLQTMKARLAKARQEEGGFTLIELMVVVLIIAILLAIAIPTFLGAQNKAKDRSAQSSLRNSVTSAKTIFADSGNYSAADSVALTPIEPSLKFLAEDVASGGPKQVSVSVTATDFYAAALSDAGSCFYVKDSTVDGGLQFAKGASTACKGTDAKAVATTDWKPNW
jgi:type IV pilus assembly protein PilA